MLQWLINMMREKRVLKSRVAAVERRTDEHVSQAAQATEKAERLAELYRRSAEAMRDHG